MNSLYEYIFKRKSVRKYKETPLSKEQLSQLEEQIESLKPLYPRIKTSCEIVDHIKSTMLIKAPHYLLFSSENMDGRLENAGFMLQQMTLYFTSIGLGSCWYGMGKPIEKQQSEMPFVIAMSFGYPEEALYRELSEFNRKSLKEISDSSDPILDAVRLAPSAMNSQNWFFICEKGMIHVYQKKLNPLKAFMLERMNSIDIGIAVCNLYMANDHFSFTKLIEYPQKKGYIYKGTMK